MNKHFIRYKILAVDYFVLTRYTRLTDGQTDRQTDFDRKFVHSHSGKD